MMSAPSRASWCAISSFSCLLSEIPGDCSPSRRVVSKIFTRLCSVRSMSFPYSFFGLRLLPFDLRQSAAATRYSPRRGRRRRRRRPARNVMPGKRTHSRLRVGGRFARESPMSSVRYLNRHAPGWVRVLLAGLALCGAGYAVLLVGGGTWVGLDPDSWWPVGALGVGAALAC